MTLFKNKYRIESNRLQGFDYSKPGLYYVTIIAHDRAHLFGDILNREMQLNETGKIIQSEWLKSPQIRPYVKLDEFIIMPNHLHGIIEITDTHTVETHGDASLRGTRNNNFDGKTKFRSPSNNLGAIIRGFKSSTTKIINEIRKSPGIPVWQRNYHDHIIRNQNSLNKIRLYIKNNPADWEIKFGSGKIQ